MDAQLQDILCQVSAKDIKERMAGIPLLEQLLKSTPQIIPSNATAIVDALLTPLKDSNFRVLESALSCVSIVIIAAQDSFVPTLINPVFDKLGDIKPSVREHALDAAVAMIRFLPQNDILKMLQNVFQHKNWRVRESASTVLIRIINEIGPQHISLKSAVGMAIDALEDSNTEVRSSAMKAIQCAYRFVGEPLKNDLRRKSVRPAQMKELQDAFDQIVLDPSVAQSVDDTVMSDSSDGYSSVRSSPKARRDGSSRGGESSQENVSISEDVTAFPLPSAEIQSELNKISATLSDMAQEKWSNRITALKQLQNLARSNVSLQMLWGIKEIMARQIVDLRSAIVKEACATVNLFAELLGDAFEPLADFFVPHLFKQICVTVQIVAESACNCMRCIISNSRIGRASVRIMDHAATNKHNVIRSRCSEFMVLWLEVGKLQDIEKYCDQIDKAIRTCVSDAVPDVRVAARRAYWAYQDIFPDRAATLFAQFDSNTQKHVKNEEKSYRAKRSAAASDSSSTASQQLRSSPTKSGNASGLRKRTISSASLGGLAPKSLATFPPGLMAAPLSARSSTSTAPFSAMRRTQSVGVEMLEEEFEQRKSHPSTASLLPRRVPAQPVQPDFTPAADSRLASAPTTVTRVTSPYSHDAMDESTDDAQLPQNILLSRAVAAGGSLRIPSRKIASPSSPSSGLKRSGSLTSLQQQFQQPAQSSVPPVASVAQASRPDLDMASTRSILTGTENIATILLGSSSSDWMDRARTFEMIAAVCERGSTRSAEILTMFSKVMDTHMDRIRDTHPRVSIEVISSLKVLVSKYPVQFEPYLEQIVSRVFYRLVNNDISAAASDFLEKVAEIYANDALIPVLLRVMDSQIPKVCLACLEYLVHVLPRCVAYFSARPTSLRAVVSKVISCCSSAKNSALCKPAGIHLLICMYKDADLALVEQLALLSLPEQTQVKGMLFDRIPTIESDIASAIKHKQNRSMIVKSSLPSTVSTRTLSQSFSYSVPHLDSMVDDDDTFVATPISPISMAQVAFSPAPAILTHATLRHAASGSSLLRNSPIEEAIPSILRPSDQGSFQADPSLTNNLASSLQTKLTLRRQEPEVLQPLLRRATKSAELFSTQAQEAAERLPSLQQALIDVTNTADAEKKHVYIKVIGRLSRAALESTDGNGDWTELFGTVLLNMLELLNHSESSIRASALEVIGEMIKNQKKFFVEMGQTSVSFKRVLGMLADADREVATAAERTANAFADQTDHGESVQIFTELIPACMPPNPQETLLVKSIDVLSRVIRGFTDDEELHAHIDKLLPSLCDAFMHPSVDVRKSVVYCFVDLYTKLGERFKPYLARLSTSQLKLVSFYVQKKQAAHQ